MVDNHKNSYLWIGIAIVVVLLSVILFFVIQSKTTKQSFYLTSKELCGSDLDNNLTAKLCWGNYDSEDGKSGLCQEPCAIKCASLNFKLSSSKFDCWSYTDVNKEVSKEGWACTRSCKCECA